MTMITSKSKAIPIGALKENTIKKGLVDELSDVELQISLRGDTQAVPRLARNFAFEIGNKDTNGDGTQNQLMFQLRGNTPDIQRVITIPETSLNGDNGEQFINHINQNYQLFYSELNKFEGGKIIND